MKKKEVRLTKRVNDFEAVNKALFEIENTLNELLEKTTQEAEFSGTEGTSGETGDIKIIHNPDKSYSFNIMTGDGWKSPVWKGSEVTFKNKPKKEKTVDKSIDAIEASDTLTGGKNAQNTIYDESSGEFKVQHLTKNQTGGLMKPDYESGWLDADKNTTVAIAHNLGLTKEPSLVQLYASDNSSPTIGTNPIVTDFHLNENWGYRMHFVDANNINIYIGASGGLYHEGTNTFGGTDASVPLETFADGYIKLKIWK